MTRLMFLIGLLPSLLCELPTIPIQVSKETTFITEPLAGDGLPNYALAIQESLQICESKDNGAVPFWQAMGQSDMTDEEFKQLSLAIELSQSDDTKPLIPLSDKSTIQAVVDWLRETGRSPDEEELQKLAEEYIAWVQSNPWTQKDVPPLARWLTENEPALDLLVEASEKPEFYSPYPNLLVDRTVSVWDMKLQHATEARKGARALMARAMNCIGENNLMGAWRDCRTIIALGNHLTSYPCLLEKIVSIEIRKTGLQHARVLLSQAKLSHELAYQILDDLTRLDRPIDVADTLNNLERMMVLDFMLRTTSGRLGGMPSEEKFEDIKENIDNMVSAGVDINLSLRWINERFDLIVLATRIQDRKEQVAQVTKLEDEFAEEGKRITSIATLGALSETFRSNIIGEIFFLYASPALKAVCNKVDRDLQDYVLTETAAALAVFKAEHGYYPKELDELTPTILKEIPSDLYTNELLRYKLIGDGYLLYSLFENETDDGGMDVDGEIRDGEWHADKQEIEREKCDLVIRIPVVPQPKP